LFWGKFETLYFSGFPNPGNVGPNLNLPKVPLGAKTGNLPRFPRPNQEISSGIKFPVPKPELNPMAVLNLEGYNAQR